MITKNITKLLLGTLAVAGLVACAGQNTPVQDDSQVVDSSSGIIGGTDVAANHPLVRHIVGIYIPIGDKAAICTGTLLPNNLILTAAHCVGPQPDKMLIVFGPRIQKGAAMLPVDAAVVSPLWATRQNEPTETGDIALLRYKGQTPAGFIPLPLLRSKQLRILDQRRGAMTLLAGYGINDGVKKSGSGILRWVSARVADANFSRSEVRLDQTQGKGACHGDSGGPAIVFIGGNPHVWGVTSRGYNDPADDCSVSAIYTNAATYEGWIDQVSAQLIQDAQRLQALRR